MILGKTLYAVDSHTAGMPTRIIVGGIPHLPGSDIEEKAEYFKNHFDYLRTAIFHEPRGLLRGVGAVITPPAHDKAHLGVFFMDCTYQLIHMCGHGSIGVITAALEFGLVEAVEPATTVVLDTPAGLVTGYAKVQGGKVESVSIHNVPSFLYSTAVIHVPGLGSIPADIAFGGEFFVLVDADNVDVPLDVSKAADLSVLAMAIRDAANAQLKVKHPLKPVSVIDAVRISKQPANHGFPIKNVTIFAKGNQGIDRSPCGTGTSAQLAALYAGGKVNVNQVSIHESIIGTTFKGRIVSQTRAGEFDAIIPEITGSAYTMSINTIILDPNDPLKHGFMIE